MKINRAYKFRIYPNLKQQKQFHLEFAATKMVYNYYLKKEQETKRLTGKGMCVTTKNGNEAFRKNAWSNDLTFLKKDEKYLWLNQSNAPVLIQALIDLETAYKNHRRQKKDGTVAKRKARMIKEGTWNKHCAKLLEKGFSGEELDPGFPNFKKYNFSIRYPNQICKYDRKNHKIQLGRKEFGWINVIDYVYAFGKINNITVSKSRDNKWYASICVEQIVKEYINNSKSQIGIDMGIRQFITDSNGNEFENLRLYDKSQEKREFLQQSLSRKKKGSNRYKRTQLKLNKLERKITARRNEHSHKISIKLAKNNSFIACEDLNIELMMNDPKYARLIQDASWGEFFRQLDYKSNWYGCKVVKVNPKNTSKTCHVCGNINNDLTIKDRDWICIICGTIHHRDINGARVVLNRGLELFANSK